MWGESVGVLVTGEWWPTTEWGSFDSVYVDMYPDYTFDYYTARFTRLANLLFSPSTISGSTAGLST